MFYSTLLSILAVLSLSITSYAQEQPIPVQIRAVLHDPGKTTADLYYTDSKGIITPLEFRPKDLTAPLMTLPLDGSLVLYNKVTVDPRNPAASIAAVVKVPSGFTKGIALVIPSAPGSKLTYRILLIDDSATAFPGGESRVIPLIGVKTAIQVGEHKVLINPGVVTKVPQVKNVNDYNMAQTNFYYEKNGKLMTFSERQLQYLEVCRRLFIVDASPGSTNPRVTTIVDVGG